MEWLQYMAALDHSTAPQRIGHHMQNDYSNTSKQMMWQMRTRRGPFFLATVALKHTSWLRTCWLPPNRLKRPSRTLWQYTQGALATQTIRNCSTI